jgi:ABC-type nickel/cobalt efflux system permease component RcnA
MSVSDPSRLGAAGSDAAMPDAAAGSGDGGAMRLFVVLAALALMAGLMGLIGWWLASGAPPPPPARSPFGVGPREAAPAATGIGAMIMAWQASFYRELTAALRLLKDSPAALPTLLGLGFAYGVVHAAGPGHGKAVISAYIMSDERSAALRGFALSLGAALVQALVAIALVLVMTMLLKATARDMNAASRWIEIVSFAAITALGLVLLWRKAGLLSGAVRGEVAACAPGCGHEAMLPPPAPRSFAQTAAVVLTAGIRPCAGAIIVLVFAASQGLVWAGIATTFAMALGTALTTGLIALLAVMAKHLALHLAGGRGQSAAVAVRAGECLAAAFVAVLGALLLFGLWSAGSGS